MSTCQANVTARTFYIFFYISAALVFVPAADLRVCVEKEQLNFFPRTLSCLISCARNLIPRYFLTTFILQLKPITDLGRTVSPVASALKLVFL